MKNFTKDFFDKFGVDRNKVVFKEFLSTIKEVNLEQRTLTALVSTGAKDRMDEVLEPEGADLKQYKKNPVILWAHRYDQPPIAKALWIKKTADGILKKIQFASTTFADEVMHLYKEGFMRAFSVGFMPLEWKDGDKKKGVRRVYTKWEMLESSAVPVPANPEALALAMSKGVLKDPALKKELGAKEEVKPKEKQKPKEKSPNPELLSTIETLKKENEKLENTILDLKYKLLQKKEKKEARTVSEMTDDDILKKIEDTVIGVIRRVTGKVS